MSQDTVFTVLPSTGRTRFLDACYRRQPDATAVWFMRQAGRSFAEYRELRKKYGILEIAKTPELSTQVTLMPVHTFGVDGAVLYADIMPELQKAGQTHVLIAPVQFLADYLEILYDIEIGVRQQAEQHGIHFARIESLNTSPLFIKALAAVAKETEERYATVQPIRQPFTDLYNM